MNKFILEELQKTKVNLPVYNNQTTELFIPKNNGLRSTVDITVGHDYAVYIEDYIINEPSNFTLSTNWNNGTKPPENKAYIRILQIMGKMVKVYCKGATTGIIWEGWIPRKGINIIDELKV